MTQLDAKTEDNNMIDQGCEQKMNFEYCNISIFRSFKSHCFRIMLTLRYMLNITKQYTT